MLSPIRKKKIDPYTQLAGSLIELVIQVHVNIQQKQKRCKTNMEYLVSIQQEIKSLQQQNLLLSQLQLAFLNMEKNCIHQDKQYEDMKLGQDKKTSQKQKQNQSYIQVILPDLTNLQQYFRELSNQSILQNYLKIKDINKIEEAKHVQNMMKLTQKLKNVDMKVNQTLALIKNQRRHL